MNPVHDVYASSMDVAAYAAQALEDNGKQVGALHIWGDGIPLIHDGDGTVSELQPRWRVLAWRGAVAHVMNAVDAVSSEQLGKLRTLDGWDVILCVHDGDDEEPAVTGNVERIWWCSDDFFETDESNDPGLAATRNEQIEEAFARDVEAYLAK